MRISQIILNEKILNIRNKSNKQKYISRIWNLLQKSYEPVGGFKSASSPEELLNTVGLWKIILRNGNISAVRIFSEKFGNKSIALASDGSIQGKKDVRMIMKDDIVRGRSWCETSDVPEMICKRMGAEPIPSRFASLLTGKNILSRDEDGYHYTRLIGGVPHTKILYGTPILSLNDLNAFEKYGIKMEDLPNNIKINNSL